jgi:ABC-type bacteriocin/lantibiotic exporter with double-glycine peptidase domain
VGRTGAGKSTLVAALFRLAEEPLASGRVLLDGVDLSTLALRDVRARKPRGMVVIPQVRSIPQQQQQQLLLQTSTP